MEETRLYDLKEYVDGSLIERLNSYIVNEMRWNYKIPGGQLRYSPPRQVNSLGTGAAISNTGRLISGGWKNTYYTSSQNSSNIGLQLVVIRL